jgi:type VI secretion system secreted protein Hcp
MPIYIKYGDIQGDVTAEGHKGEEGWVEVDSFQFGISRSISSPTGGGKDRESSAPSISEIVVTKPADNSSVQWLDHALQGNGVKATIDFCMTDEGQLKIYQQYQLENALVSSFSVTSGGDRPRETISLSFTKLEFAFYQVNEDDGFGDTPRTGYDIALGRKI